MAVFAGTEAGIRRPHGSFALEDREITALARHPGQPRVLLAAAYGGAFASEDGGTTWQPIGLDGLDVWTIAVRGDGSLWAGVEPAALYRRGWPGGGWERVGGLDGAPGASDWHSPWGPADLSSIVFFGDEIWIGIEVGGVYASSDGGRTWRAESDGLYEDVHTVAVTPAARYAATGAGFYRSDGGAWAAAGRGISRGYVMPIVVDPSDPTHLWTAGADGPPPAWRRGARPEIYESRDAALSWTALPALPASGAVQRKALAAANGGLWAGTADGALLSFDGARWDAVASDLPPVACVLPA